MVTHDSTCLILICEKGLVILILWALEMIARRILVRLNYMAFVADTIICNIVWIFNEVVLVDSRSGHYILLELYD